eukprot:2933053-Amphidinium_carterae.1
MHASFALVRKHHPECGGQTLSLRAAEPSSTWRMSCCRARSVLTKNSACFKDACLHSWTRDGAVCTSQSNLLACLLEDGLLCPGAAGLPPPLLRHPPKEYKNRSMQKKRKEILRISRSADH